MRTASPSNVDKFERLVRAKRPKRVPVVLTRGEVRAVLTELQGIYKLMATLLYGTGMRVMECLRLRVKDIDFERREITVRAGKGNKDRRTMLPVAVAEELLGHRDVKTTEIYTHVLNRGPAGVPSPADRL